MGGVKIPFALPDSKPSRYRQVTRSRDYSRSEKFFLAGAVRERPLREGHEKLFLRIIIKSKYGVK